MSTVTTTDPRTGATAPTPLEESTASDVAAVVAAAAAAATPLERAGREARAALLERIAEEVEAVAPELVSIAESETGLAAGRLLGEAHRSALQFRLFAEVAREGSYVEAAIDRAGTDALGPAPDVRRMLVPIGPVAVFGASNFPFAFSALGGDTAAALAAGCPVVLKAHPLHPLTTHRSVELLRAALADSLGLPDAVGVVYGFDAGRALLLEPDVRAACLTGSLGAARAMEEVIARRANPIPLYGELGSINPLVVLPGAAAERPADLAEQLFASFTGSQGQLCTKPGIVFLPHGEDGTAVRDALAARVSQSEPAPMLSFGIRDAFSRRVGELEADGADVVAVGRADQRHPGAMMTPVLLEAPASALVDTAGAGRTLTEECFGPAMLLLRYASTDELTAALRTVPHALTCTIHRADADDLAQVRTVLDVAEQLAGRVIFDGLPTGVRVSWAQHHGGAWPATNSLHTSVGASSIRRFLQPRAYQNAPDALLPVELRDGFTEIPRRIDGALVVAGA